MVRAGGPYSRFWSGYACGKESFLGVGVCFAFNRARPCNPAHCLRKCRFRGLTVAFRCYSLRCDNCSLVPGVCSQKVSIRHALSPIVVSVSSHGTCKIHQLLHLGALLPAMATVVARSRACTAQKNTHADTQTQAMRVGSKLVGQNERLESRQSLQNPEPPGASAGFLRAPPAGPTGARWRRRSRPSRLLAKAVSQSM